MRRDAIGGIESHAPEIRALRIDDQRPEIILGLSRQRARDDQVLAPLRNFRACGDEVEGRRLPDVDPRAVRALQFQREIERALLHVHQCVRGDEQPVRPLGVGGRVHRLFQQPHVRDRLVADRDVDLRPREVDREIPPQRL